MPTPSPSRVKNPLEKISEQLFQFDFTKPGAPDAAETLYMLTQQELNAKRKTDDFVALRDEIKRWRTTADANRLPFEQEWLSNLDMYEGRHFNRWDQRTRKTVTTVTPEGEVRIPMNFIQPVIRTELAKTTSSHPTASVAPASNDDADILAAKAAEAIWEWAWSKEKVQSRVLNPANFWRATTGNGFVKTFIDLHAEDDAATAAALQEWREEQASRAPELTSLLGSTPKPECVYGKATFTAVSPFHLWFADLNEKDIQRQPWIIQGALIPVETAKRIYSKVMPEDWEPKKVAATVLFDQNRLGMSANQNSVDQTLVLEAWIRPNVTKHLPEGGLVIIVDDEIVAMSENGLPYDHNELPFQHMYSVESTGFYRKSVIVALTPLQHEFNRIFAQLIKYKNMASQPRWLYRPGSVDPTRIRNVAGQWIPITLGMDMPKMLELPEMPQYVTGLIESIRTIVDDISGQHQVSRAISPGADTAASTVGLLREADDDYLSNTLDSIEALVESMGHQYLSNVVQFWDEPRLIKVAGDNERTSAQVLTGADVATATDIRVSTGSGLPQSRSARQALVMELMKEGYVDSMTGLKVIAEGALGKLYNRLTIDEDQAERENVEMARMTEEQYQLRVQEQAGAMQNIAQTDPELAMQGAQAEAEGLIPQPPVFPVNEWDNHTVHRIVVERRMKSQEWLGYPDWKQQMFLEHWRAHKAAEVGQMQEEAMLDAAGAPGGAAGSPSNDAGPSGSGGYTDSQNGGQAEPAPSNETSA